MAEEVLDGVLSACRKETKLVVYCRRMKASHLYLYL